MPIELRSANSAETKIPEETAISSGKVKPKNHIEFLCAL